MNTMRLKISRLLSLRDLALIAVALTFVIIVTIAAVEFYLVERAMVIHKLDSESSRFASTLYFEKLRALAQLTVAVMGGAWALLTVSGQQVRVGDPATRWCFWLANLSFLLSLFVYVYGYDFIVERIFHHSAFDIDAPLVVFVSKWQQVLFANGCGDLVLLVLLGRKTP